MSDVEVSRTINASPEQVWSAISDVTRMGEWSPECRTCKWIEGHEGPAVGAKFSGANKNGDFEWETECEVIECVPNEVFAFDGVFGDLHFAKWAYRIEPTDGGCVVTEAWEDGRPKEIIEYTAGVSGVADRAEHNRKGMEITLERLAAAVE